MMAGMFAQLPLPLLRSGAAEIAPGVGLVTGAGGGGLVSVCTARGLVETRFPLLADLVVL
jgi:hypothetical protein